jgi:hypothetical protein
MNKRMKMKLLDYTLISAKTCASSGMFGPSTAGWRWTMAVPDRTCWWARIATWARRRRDPEGRQGELVGIDPAGWGGDPPAPSQPSPRTDPVYVRGVRQATTHLEPLLMAAKMHGITRGLPKHAAWRAPGRAMSSRSSLMRTGLDSAMARKATQASPLSVRLGVQRRAGIVRTEGSPLRLHRHFKNDWSRDP